MIRVLVAVMLGALLLTGCPREKRALDVSRKVVEFTTEIVTVVDKEAAAMFQTAVEQAMVACEDEDTPAAQEACALHRLDKWFSLREAMEISFASLEALDAALDAWEAGSPNGQLDFRRAAACMLDSLKHVAEAFAAVGKNVPRLDVAIDAGVATFGFDASEPLCGVTS